MPTRKVSRRAQEAWTRFASWYGADVLDRKYGLTPPQDWCEVLDELDRETLAAVMAETKSKFPSWMPGLPEFEAIVRQIKAPTVQRGPSIMDQLHDFVMANYRLTPRQLRGPRTWLHRDGVISGVVIPADGDTPGFRVMAEDMQLVTDARKGHG